MFTANSLFCKEDDNNCWMAVADFVLKLKS